MERDSMQIRLGSDPRPRLPVVVNATEKIASNISENLVREWVISNA